jgi:heme exporter protein A
MEPRLIAQDLACRRGERLLFRGLSFSLAPGAALQVTGPNGSGKSSLIRILAGLLRPFAGSVVREGEVGLVDERPALDEQQATGDALAFWRTIDRTTDAAHPRLDLARLAEVPFGYLSTGQRKRAALARLQGQRAAIWLLDEPLNGLDTAAIETTEALVAHHCEAGGIAVIASHQPFALAGLGRIDIAEWSP